jgi:hypothetical protein
VIYNFGLLVGQTFGAQIGQCGFDIFGGVGDMFDADVGEIIGIL